MENYNIFLIDDDWKNFLFSYLMMMGTTSSSLGQWGR